jgi:hypothetical protein
MVSKLNVVERQIELQHKLQSMELNIITCCNCDSVLIHEKVDETIQCFCGEIHVNDCSDLYYTGMEENLEFKVN